MAEILESYDFGALKNTAHYPWAEWSDGKIRRLKRGTDFQSTVVVFQSLIHAQAKRHGFRARTSSLGDALIFQFYKPEENGQS